MDSFTPTIRPELLEEDEDGGAHHGQRRGRAKANCRDAHRKTNSPARGPVTPPSTNWVLSPGSSEMKGYVPMMKGVSNVAVVLEPG